MIKILKLSAEERATLNQHKENNGIKTDSGAVRSIIRQNASLENYLTQQRRFDEYMKEEEQNKKGAE